MDVGRSVFNRPCINGLVGFQSYGLSGPGFQFLFSAVFTTEDFQMVTAVDEENTREAAMKAGFNDYLVKPDSEDRIRKILAETSSKTG